MSDETTPEELCRRVELFAGTLAGFVGVSIRSRDPVVIAVAFSSINAAHEYVLALETLGRSAATIAMAPGDDTTVLLRELPSRDSGVQAEKPLADTSSAFAASPRSNGATAWSRWLARVWLDYGLFSIALAVLVEITAPQSGIMDSEYGLVWLTLVLWIPVEAVLIAAVGQTPGKALLGLRVARSDGTRLSYREAGRRALAVFVRNGLMIPIVCLFTFSTEYKRVRTGKQASWDEAGGFEVTSQRLSVGRRALVALVVLAFLSLVVWGSTVSAR